MKKQLMAFRDNVSGLVARVGSLFLSTSALVLSSASFCLVSLIIGLSKLDDLSKVVVTSLQRLSEKGPGRCSTARLGILW